MPTELILGFNGGEVSRNIESRIDLPLYKKSASIIENFEVLPEGGARNRAGTKFISKTAGDTVAGDQTAHLTKFSYSDDYSYMFEFGNQYIKIFNVQTQEEVDTLVSPYSVSDALDIQFDRSYDVMWFVHPSYPEQTITRTAVDAFTIEQTEYDFPPMSEQNDTTTTLTPGARTGTGVSLVGSDDLFEAEHVGSQWLIKQLRTVTNIVSGVEFGPSVNGTASGTSGSTTWLHAGFSKAVFSTDNTWNGRLSIEVSYNGGTTTEELLFIADTTGGNSANYADNIDSRLSANAIIRFHWESLTGTLKYSLNVVDSYNYGLVEITAVTDAQNAVCDVINDLYDTSSATTWSEGAFSEVKGYPRTVTLFEERKWYCGIGSGINSEPNVLLGSRTDDFYDYFIGTDDDEGIRRSPLVNGFASWLSSKEELFLSTTNEVIVVSGLVSSQGLTPENLKFNVQSSDGSDYMQSELVNDVVVYTQKGKKKLRELIYDDGNKTFVTNDLSALAKHIAKIGITSIELQKLPDQRIHCILENGKMGVLAYERSEDVVAWYRYATDGNYKSVAVAQNGEEDSVWYVIERNGEYFIEVQQSRDDNDLYWYVDSGNSISESSVVESESIEIVTEYPTVIEVSGSDATSLNGDYVYTGSFISNRPSYTFSTYTLSWDSTWNGVGAWLLDSPLDPEFYIENNDFLVPTSGTWSSVEGASVPVFKAIYSVTINKSGHGLSDGDNIQFADVVGYDYLNGKVFTVAGSTANTFKLKSDDGTTWINYTDFETTSETIIVDGGGSSSYDGIYSKGPIDHFNRYTYFKDGDYYYGNVIWYDGDFLGAWVIDNQSYSLIYENRSTEDLIDPEAPFRGWVKGTFGANPVPSVYYRLDDIIASGNYLLVSNRVDSLEHLEGETVRAVGDQKYLGEFVVESGSIELEAYYNSIVAGLPYTSTLSPLPIDLVQQIFTIGNQKTVSATNVKLKDSIGGLIGSNLNNMERINDRMLTDEIGTQIDPVNNDVQIYFQDSWDDIKRIYVQQDLPLPFEILSLSMEVKSGGK